MQKLKLNLYVNKLRFSKKQSQFKIYFTFKTKSNTTHFFFFFIYFYPSPRTIDIQIKYPLVSNAQQPPQAQYINITRPLKPSVQQNHHLHQQQQQQQTRDDHSSEPTIKCKHKFNFF